jgi:hypothetical protein
MVGRKPWSMSSLGEGGVVDVQHRGGEESQLLEQGVAADLGSRAQSSLQAMAQNKKRGDGELDGDLDFLVNGGGAKGGGTRLACQGTEVGKTRWTPGISGGGWRRGGA